ncbi:MAG: hypothetical protein ACD_69C00016G0001, partial [uncultured bacterium]
MECLNSLQISLASQVFPTCLGPARKTIFFSKSAIIFL